MALILLAEDDDVIRGLVAHKLRGRGHTILEASSGTEALALASAQPPDAVVLDWMMPGHNGLEVTEALRNDSATASCAVILLTARAQEADIERGFDAGVDDYVVKPFSPRELATRVEAAIARQSR